MKILDLVMQKIVVFYWKNSLLLERSIAPTASSSTYPNACAASAGRAGRGSPRHGLTRLFDSSQQ